MLTVSNLDHMRSNVMRKLFDLFEVAYHIQMEEDLRVSELWRCEYLRLRI